MPAVVVHNLGPRLPVLPASRRTVQQGIGNSYVITNRSDPSYSGYWWDEPSNIVPLGNGNMWWYMSTVAVNDPTVSDYNPQSTNPSTSPPSPFWTAITAQLSQQTNPQLTVFIHGLGTEWNYAINDTATLGANLLSSATYQGLVIGFDWPSYGETASGAYYASSYPPTATSGTIRDNINGSIAAFGHLIDLLQNLRSKISNLTVNLVCHSEGNYMTMLGMAGISSVHIDEIVLLAADINNGAFQTPAGGLIGQAIALSTWSDRVTVYYTSNDNVLADSQGAFQEDPITGQATYHNPLYGGRLGLTGPAYDQGKQPSNVYSVNCSTVINEQVIAKLRNNNTIPSSVILHSSYFYVPQILQDIAATLTATPAGNIANRVATANPNAYVMKLV